MSFFQRDVRLTQAQRQTLAAICDTLLAPVHDGDSRASIKIAAGVSRPHPAQELAAPAAAGGSSNAAFDGSVPGDALSQFMSMAATDSGDLINRIEDTLARHVPADVLTMLLMLLNVMNTSAGMLALTGFYCPFVGLSPGDRQRAMAGFQGSFFAAKRHAFKKIKALIFLRLGGDATAFGPEMRPSNPLWRAVGYDGPLSATEAAAAAARADRAEHPFPKLNASIGRDTHLPLGTFDAVIVGSGCGGGVVAAELSAAGWKVLVVEKGEHVERSRLSGTEQEFSRLYEQGGLMITEGSGITVLAGATFGGGSTVNWACCLPTPGYVREEWASEHGLPHFVSGTYKRHLDEVSRRLHVRDSGVAHNRTNELLIAGCKACGYPVKSTGQNMASVEPFQAGASEIGVGDRTGLKQSMPETFLKEAAENGCQFLDRCLVTEVTQRNGKASGIRGRVVGADGSSIHNISIDCGVVVVACGSIHTPVLLGKSQLPGINRSGQLGKNLRLHPVSGVVGILPKAAEPVDMWRGAPMTTVSSVPGPDGAEYGSKLECPNAGPGLLSVVVPWKGAADYKNHMVKMRRCFAFIVLGRDRGSGEVRTDAEGWPRIYYDVSMHDKASVLMGLERAVRAAAAAGAEEIGTGQNCLEDCPRRLPPMPTGDEPESVQREMETARMEAVEQLVADVKAYGISDDGRTDLFSAHQMGTARMHGSPSRGVVSPTGETWAIKNLYVADTSVFPTPSGANPMMTVLAISYGTAQHIKAAGRPNSRAHL